MKRIPVSRMVITLLAVLLVLIPARAQEEKAEGGFGVNLVYPPGETPRSYFLYDISPGHKADREIELTNRLPYALKVLVYPADCYNTPDGALAGPLYGEKSSVVGTWVTLGENELILGPGRKKRLNFTLTVPENAGSGDHFGFIFLQASPEKEEQEKKDKNSPGTAAFTVKVQQRLGICLVVRIPGEKKADLEIASVEKAVDPKGRLFLCVNIENRGNIYLKPRVAWDLKNPSGESILYSDPTEMGYLLPGHPLRLQIPLLTDRPLARGAYELLVSVECDENKEEKKSIIQLP